MSMHASMLDCWMKMMVDEQHDDCWVMVWMLLMMMCVGAHSYQHSLTMMQGDVVSHLDMNVMMTTIG